MDIIHILISFGGVLNTPYASRWSFLMKKSTYRFGILYTFSSGSMCLYAIDFVYEFCDLKFAIFKLLAYLLLYKYFLLIIYQI